MQQRFRREGPGNAPAQSRIQPTGRSRALSSVVSILRPSVLSSFGSEASSVIPAFGSSCSACPLKAGLPLCPQREGRAGPSHRRYCGSQTAAWPLPRPPRGVPSSGLPGALCSALPVTLGTTILRSSVWLFPIRHICAQSSVAVLSPYPPFTNRNA